jgi:hypothetical protein
MPSSSSSASTVNNWKGSPSQPKAAIVSTVASAVGSKARQASRR